MPFADRPVDVALKNLLDALQAYLPDPLEGVPDATLGVARMSERAIGLGDHRGTETRASFAVVEIKGLRLDAIMHFVLWNQDPVAAEEAARTLQTRLTTDRVALAGKGFRRLQLHASSPAEAFDFSPPSDAPPDARATQLWRKQVDYQVLFEHAYSSTDGAESLIVRIPIDSHVDEPGNGSEHTLVTDRAVRWDNELAPPLVVRGRTRIGSVSALAHLGLGPSGAVALRRTFDGASGAPTLHATLASLLTAVGGKAPAETHAEVTFANVSAFVIALGSPGAPVTLGDWDKDLTPDSYGSGALAINPPIELPNAGDRFEIDYQGAAFDQVGILYLRALSA